MDKISLNAIKAEAVIGTFPHERTTPQPVIADIDIFCDLAPAGKSDMLEDTVDYFELEERIFRLISDSQFHLLERLADHIAASVLSDIRITGCRVKLTKPLALKHSGPVSLEIVRERKNLL